MLEKDLFALGTEVFGSAEEFRAWLHLPAGEFQGALPISLLSTSTGIDLVVKLHPKTHLKHLSCF